jgi:hypothetical protein
LTRFRLVDEVRKRLADCVRAVTVIVAFVVAVVISCVLVARPLASVTPRVWTM